MGGRGRGDKGEEEACGEALRGAKVGWVGMRYRPYWS